MSEDSSAPFLDCLNWRYGEECGNDVYEYFVSRLFSGGDWRKRFIGRLVDHFVTNVELVTLEEFEEPLVRYRAQIKPPQRGFLDAYRS